MSPPTCVLLPTAIYIYEQVCSSYEDISGVGVWTYMRTYLGVGMRSSHLLLYICRHSYYYVIKTTMHRWVIATTMYKNNYAQVEPCVGSWMHASVWEVCVPKYCDQDNAPPPKK